PYTPSSSRVNNLPNTSLSKFRARKVNNVLRKIHLPNLKSSRQHSRSHCILTLKPRTRKWLTTILKKAAARPPPTIAQTVGYNKAQPIITARETACVASSIIVILPKRRSLFRVNNAVELNPDITVVNAATGRRWVSCHAAGSLWAYHQAKGIVRRQVMIH